MSANLKHTAFMSELSDLLNRYSDIMIRGNGLGDGGVIVYDYNSEITLFDGSLEEELKSISKQSRGIVDIDGNSVSVKYHFVSEDTIQCVDDVGNVFLTHYKSLEG